MPTKKRTPSRKQEEEVLVIDIKPFLGPVAIVIAGIIISASILIGSLSINSTIKKLDNYTGVEQVKGEDTAEVDDTNQEAEEVEVEKVDEGEIEALFTDGNIALGDKDAKVTFVEVSDPSCPYCHIAGGHNPELAKQVGERFQYDSDGGSYIPPVREMRKLVEEGKASYVWLYKNGHGNGLLGAQALYCANEKGKFWDVQALLMTNAGYEMLNSTVMNDVAKSGQLASFLASAIDEGFMKGCLESEKYSDKLNEDEQITTALGTQGTPGLYVNGQYFRGAYSFSDMQSIVDEAL